MTTRLWVDVDQYHGARNMSEYVVIANKLNLRASPIDGAILAVLPKGQILIPYEQSSMPGWLKVETSIGSTINEVTGYVSENYVVNVDPSPVPTTSTPLSNVSVDQLRKLTPQGNIAITSAIAQEFQTGERNYGLTVDGLRFCHFIAQAAHESDGFRTTREYWGPTAAQRRYEGRVDLGNTHPGDGRRFLGRGLFQLTGRANYESMGRTLSLDLISDPERAADPTISLKVAFAYWNSKKLNVFADSDNIREITRRINGGYNGLDARRAYYLRAREIWG
jgi:putative chitinase